METKLTIFKVKEIRRILHNDEWWFSIADIVEVLTLSADPRQYIKRMRKRDAVLNSYWGTICTPLPLQAPDGKMRKSNCANTEGVFRIIQSIPSPKAEPFKQRKPNIPVRSKEMVPIGVGRLMPKRSR